MTVSRQFYVYAVKDEQGNVWMGIVDEPREPLHIYGMRDKDNALLGFNGVSYLIPAWCVEHGLQCVATVRTIDVEFP